MSAELLTAAQVGRLLGVDTSTVYRMAGDGRLPAVRVGRQWRFPADRITQFLQVGTPTTAGPATPPAVPAVATETLTSVVDLVADSLGVMMVVTDHLDGAGRDHVLRLLPRLAAILSPLVSPPLPGTPPSNGLAAAASRQHQGALS